MNDEKLRELAKKYPPFEWSDASATKATLEALRELAADHDAEVTRLKAEIERLKGEFDDREIIEDNCKLKERLAAADGLIREKSTDCFCHHFPSGPRCWGCRAVEHLARSPASESAKPCQFDGDGRCEWHTHQLEPDVTAHELLNNRINALNVQLAEVRTGYVKLEARVTAELSTRLTKLEERYKIQDSYVTTEGDRLSDLYEKLEARIKAIEPAFRTKPVPEPPLVTHLFMAKVVDDGLCGHWNDEKLCGLPESRHQARSK